MSTDICRDFEKGDCRRGTRCKFFHPKLQICKDFQNRKCERPKCRFLHVSREEEEAYDNSGIYPEHLDKEKAKMKRIMTGGGGGGGGGHGNNFGGNMYGKRRRDDSDYGPMNSGYTPMNRGGYDTMPYNHNPMPIPPALVEENQVLKQKVSELQKQIVELRQMNDTLYDQNTQYRDRLRGSSAPATTPKGINHTSVGDRDLVGNTNYYDFSSY